MCQIWNEMWIPNNHTYSPGLFSFEWSYILISELSRVGFSFQIPKTLIQVIGENFFLL